ncbi:MAG: prepilin-type N-terminal cleavage/methylation domain-containing protein [Desulfuromonadaceae bacterium]|nr:prepilin-type N-terminal cleavage/methylation domain-containing protein [Desulfuromonadaceae bacterium]
MTGSNQRGFSLMELITAMALMALMAAITVPAFNAWLAGYRLKGSAMALVGHLQRARSEALSKQTNCAITFNTTVGGVTYDYIVYLDSSGDLKYDAGETLLVTVKLADQPGISFKSGGIDLPNNTSGKPSVAFNPLGMPRDKDGGFGDGSVTLKNNRGSEKMVALSAVGNVRIN